MVIYDGVIVKDANEAYIVEGAPMEGGLAKVYIVRKISDNTHWVLKTLKSNFANKDEYFSLMNDLKMALEIDSPNAIKYIYAHDGNTYPKLPPYIIMEYADNGSLLDLLQARKQQQKFFNHKELYEILLQLANGMKAINAKLIHRDIKPGNILIKNNRFIISDFGLAKIANENTRHPLTFKGWGTDPYMAPEAWDNDANTIKMDIYSMGIVFYELATLNYPYLIKSGNSSEYMNAHKFQSVIDPKPINPDIPDSLVFLITYMLNKKHNERYNSWDQIIQALNSEVLMPTKDNRLVSKLLSNFLEKDSQKAEYEALTIKRKEERSAITKLVEYQIESEIYSPLEILISELNTKIAQSKVYIQKSEERFNRHLGVNESERITFETQISLDKGKYFYINITPMFPEDYIHSYDHKDRPLLSLNMDTFKIDDRKIIAWGGLYYDEHDHDKSIFNQKRNWGFNLILLENGNEEYGEWVIIKGYSINKTQNNPSWTPFAFSIDRLEDGALKEIDSSKDTYKYEILPFSIELVVDVILELND